MKRVAKSPKGETSSAVAKRAVNRVEAVKSLQDFIDWVSARPAPRYVFRGQNGDWPLIPTVGRDGRSYRPERELQLLKEFKRSALPYIGQARLASDWEWLALGQHHGLPTRLLDWTTNAMVAAFFACGSSKAEISQGQVFAVRPPRDAMVDTDDEKRGPFDQTAARFMYTPTLASRIAAQRGLFSIHPKPTEPYTLEAKEDTFVFLPHVISDVRKHLHRLGIDEHFLMGGLDGLSATLRWRFESRMIFA